MALHRSLPAAALLALVLAAPAAAAAAPSTGGAAFPGARAAQAPSAAAPAPTLGGAVAGEAPADPTVPGAIAQLGPDGTAVAPADAPPEVAKVIAAANRIATLPYRYGGGHRRFADTAYDCSGSVSFALHGADLLDAPLASTGLEDWGARGAGRWITVYANAEHAFMVVAGLRFDTSGQREAGTRWQPMDRTTSGFVVRHPSGL